MSVLDDPSAAHIRIRRPIPLGVSSTILTAIGRVYPTSVVEDSGSDAVHIVIPYDAVADAAEMAALKPAESVGPGAAELVSNGPGGVEVRPAEEIGAILAQSLRDLITEHDPANYLQFTYEVGPVSAGDDERYVMVVARSKAQTPWELHHQAEDRLAAVREAAQSLPAKHRAVILAAVGDAVAPDPLTN